MLLILYGIDSDRLQVPVVAHVNPTAIILYFPDTTVEYSIDTLVVHRDTLIRLQGPSYHGMVLIRPKQVVVYVTNNRTSMQLLFLRNRSYYNKIRRRHASQKQNR
jgi:hypothetical protein